MAASWFFETMRCNLASPSRSGLSDISPRVKCRMQPPCLSRQSLSSTAFASPLPSMGSPKHSLTYSRSSSALFSPVSRPIALGCPALLERFMSPLRTRAPRVYLFRPKPPMNCGSFPRLSRRSMPPVTPKYSASISLMRETISSLLSSGGNSRAPSRRSSRSMSL